MPHRALHRRRRRRRASWATGAAALVTAGALLWQGTHATVPLYQSTVGVDHLGQVVPVPPDTDPSWVPGTRVILPKHPMDDADRDLATGTTYARAAQDLTWLAAGSLPGAGTEYGPMVRTMLLDLRTLTHETGAPVAGWQPRWRYTWPRDAAFVAVAYARTGHRDDALEALLFIQNQQGPDGALQARYLPDGSGVPDERGLQEDGQGWMLWASLEVLRSYDETDETDEADETAEAAGAAEQLRALIQRSTQRLMGRIDLDTGLPRPSSDYWEVPEDELTLGIAATSLMGLDSAAELIRRGWGGELELEAVEVTRQRLQERIVETFGARGYPRQLDTRTDAAVAFLLPPYVACPVPGAELARLRSISSMRREGGGLAPGATWKQDGISWTPETGLYALAAAHTGRTTEARRWLSWLGSHRTPDGSVPEKVLYNGDPAAVAPLAWSAALVVLTVAALEDPPTFPLC